ncbi:MAG TPA: hypothetical protein VFU83_05345 [Pyrinomonadaceae bacterium]|nr:hypothetical protein [Pyrinomonadaceae bacterium]
MTISHFTSAQYEGQRSCSATEFVFYGNVRWVGIELFVFGLAWSAFVAIRSAEFE